MSVELTKPSASPLIAEQRGLIRTPVNEDSLL